ncbi:SseB family protein [uncultured Methanobrevibacter sp.]|uniref:SseB family protein n=1 Tax=uncultured Methanobrevibacter sp. TaxID=253161 RepID=UPI0026016320|nr:hypothetical protein [uncultured Methanobrevibacter sp.]
MKTHEHLRNAVGDYCLCESKDILIRLINELRYSNLFIPSRKVDGKLVFDIYGDGEASLTPIFTDMDEVAKFYGDDDIKVFSNSFELYRNILNTSDIEGYILNPASENYILTKEFILAITDIPKTTYVSPDPYAPETLKLLSDDDNQGLERAVEIWKGSRDYEVLFEAMSDSTIMVMMTSQNDLSSFFTDGILDMRITGPVASMHVDEIGGKYAAIFSSKEKMGKVETRKHRYAQVINLSMLVNYVLFEDMDGIILNPSSDDVLISRQMLLNYSLGFEKYADDERLSDSIYYIFEL